MQFAAHATVQYHQEWRSTTPHRTQRFPAVQCFQPPRIMPNPAFTPSLACLSPRANSRSALRPLLNRSTYSRPHNRSQRTYPACATQTPTSESSTSRPSSPSRSFGPLTFLLFLSALVLTPLISLLHLITVPFPSLALRLTTIYLRLLLKLSLIKTHHHIPTALPPPPFLLVSNSQSPLDIFILATLPTPLRFILPLRARQIPLLGWILHRAGYIFAASGRKGAMEAMNQCVRRLNQGQSVVVFPEPGMSQTGILRSFGALPFKMATKAGVPVLPVTVNGTASVMAGGSVPCRFPKGGVHVTVHDVIDTCQKSEKEIAVEAEAAVRSGLPVELRGNQG